MHLASQRQHEHHVRILPEAACQPLLDVGVALDCSVLHSIRHAEKHGSNQAVTVICSGQSIPLLLPVRMALDLRPLFDGGRSFSSQRWEWACMGKQPYECENQTARKSAEIMLRNRQMAISLRSDFHGLSRLAEGGSSNYSSCTRTNRSEAPTMTGKKFFCL
ncbi:MAG: hypothetical protein ABI127_10240, partial [Dokdonella sp.]